MRKRYQILSLLLLLSASGALAQTRKEVKAREKAEKIKQIYREKGDIDFNLYKFKSAAVLYRLADTTSAHVIAQLAKAHFAFKDYASAEHWYAKQAKLDGQPDQFMLEYAATLASNGKHQLSSDWYAKYALKFPNDRRAAAQAKAYGQLHLFRQDEINWQVSYPVFNTPKDEFSPIYFNRGLIFTSNRDMKWGVNKTFGWNETPFTDLYFLEDTATVKTVDPANYFNDSTYLVATQARIQQLPKTIADNRVLGTITYPKTIAFLHLMADSANITLMGRDINTSLHDGPMSISRDLKHAFYNRNNFRTSKGGKNKAGVYKLNMFSASNAGGKWYDIRPFEYNSLEYSTAHPALTPDGNTLYFVSDMPGGFGGKDLYYTVRSGKSWSKPVNMGGTINTEGDETFPYVAPDGTLYFSSTGHAGLGGLDLFKVTLQAHEPVSKIVNLGMPVNSTKDDFGLIIDAQNASGYFSSNRYGSDDIFKFNYAPVVVKLEGKIVTNYQNGKIAVPNAMVYLTYNNKVDSIASDNVGHYKFDLVVNTPYTISASKPEFDAPAKGNVTTVGIRKSTILIKDLELMRRPIVAIAPPSPLVDCGEAGKLLKIENIFYDLDKFNIRADALPAMNHLLRVLNAYPSLELKIKSHTDSRASAAYNMKLSSNRAKSVIDWLSARGISKARLSSEYFGKRKLVNGCGDGVDCSEDVHQINRRSEFYLFNGKKNITINCDL